MPMAMDKAQVTLPSDREVKVTRSFRAPRTLVYRAYTEPELVRRWLLGPSRLVDAGLRDGRAGWRPVSVALAE